MGWALLATLRTVAEREKSDALLWTGSWTEPSVQAVQSGPSAARLRGIRAGSAYDAWGRTSRNPPVAVRAPPAPPSLSCDDALLSAPCDRVAGTFSGLDGRRMYARGHGAVFPASRISAAVCSAAAHRIDAPIIRGDSYGTFPSLTHTEQLYARLPRSPGVRADSYI